MIQLFIQLAQTVAGAVLTIISLLIVAVIIGFFTAWLYAKSKYIPVIKGLEADKTELKKHMAIMDEDILKLRAKAEKLNDKINKLEEEAERKDKEIKKLTKAGKKQKLDV